MSPETKIKSVYLSWVLVVIYFHLIGLGDISANVPRFPLMMVRTIDEATYTKTEGTAD